MTTQSPATHLSPSAHFYGQSRPAFAHTETIDLTLDDDPLDHGRQIKRLRPDIDVRDFSLSNSPTPSIATPSPSISHSQMPPGKPVALTSLHSQPQLLQNGVQTGNGPQLKFSGPSESSAFFGPRSSQSRPQAALARQSSAPASTLTNPQQRLQQRQVIDLTASPSPPPQGSAGPRANTDAQQSSRALALNVPPKTPVCIGQLTVTALVLYPVNYLQPPDNLNAPTMEAEWAGVKLHYDATAKARNPGAEETIHILTPPIPRPGTGELLPGEDFGVVEQKISTILGPMLGKGLIRIDAKVRRGVPNLPILPLQMLVHTPNGNIPIVSRYFQQHGLLLDHPSPAWDSKKLSQLLYLNPHDPPPGGHARNLFSSSRSGYPSGGRWSTPAVSGKSVEVQRSQVDEVFKSLKSGDDLEETEPSPDIATKLYPHQKKALTFLLDREGEIESSSRSTLWQPRIVPHKQTKIWVNLVTQCEVHTEPPQCKGALLADDMGLGKTITCVSLIAATLPSAYKFASMPLTPPPKLPLEYDGSAPSINAAHFSGAVWGMPDATSSNDSAKKKAKLAKEKEKWEAEYARAKRIKVRSRATLIICPLSTVVNWEEQFKEHWAGEVQVYGGAGNACTSTSCSTASTPKPLGASTSCSVNFCSPGPSADVSMDGMTPEPNSCDPGSCNPNCGSSATFKKGNTLKVYVYHGNSRRPDPAFLADFDAVITTYATLASEYSKQTRSIAAAAAEDDDEGSSENMEDGNVEYDENGNPLVELKERKSLKRKKTSALFSGFVEASSPLQSVHWFRVVLDEAHAIKETTTVGSRASCDLEADRRLCLTGTPVQNKLDDVYALIKFLRVNPFDDRNIWQEFIGVPVKFGQPLGVARLQTIMKCITLRRTKESKTRTGQAILTLPPRRDELRLLRFDDQEKAIYDKFFTESRAEFKELSNKNEVMKNYVDILQKILRLRQICDHFELVDGKGPGAELGLNFEEISKAIAEEGLNATRANAIFAILREAGTAQCVECGCELGVPSDQQQDTGMEVNNCTTSKRGRKPKASSSRAPTRPGSPVAYRPVLSRCQHLFCASCFQTSVFPCWPNLPAGGVKQCSVCQTTLQTTDVAEVNPDCNPVDFIAKKRPIRKEKRTKGISLDDFHPSTKVRALLGDLVVFSRMNPYSKNYDPSSVEIQMVDEKGNQLDDGVIKTVVFSQWTSMLDKIEDALEIAGIRYDRLDGTMKRDERMRAMEALKNDPACEVLLVSLKAGGVGLNLTAAQRVYLMDPYWNPAVENQAVDRIHRLGQTRPVTTIKLIIENSIEERLLEVQRKKTELANMTLGQHLSKAEIIQRRMEDLQKLFSS